MKRFLSICIALILAITLAAAAALAEDSEPMPAAAEAFEGIWMCENMSIEMYWEELGFKVLIRQGRDKEETTWEYSCFYNEDDHTVSAMPFGMRTDYLFDASGDLASTTVAYEDGEATFSLDEEGCLIWDDLKENAGEGYRFEKIDGSEEDLAEEEYEPMPVGAEKFEGTWQCDRAVIEMYWEEEGFRVMARWSSSASEATVWEYSGYYEETDTVNTVPFGIRTDYVYDGNGEIISVTEAYDDGSAVFSLDEEGCLIWQDEKENAGAGMRFVKMPAALLITDY